MTTWRFRSSGAWRWERVDEQTGEVVTESATGYVTLRECVNDAHRHGCVEPYESVCDAILTDASVSPHRLRPPPATRY